MSIPKAVEQNISKFGSRSTCATLTATILMCPLSNYTARNVMAKNVCLPSLKLSRPISQKRSTSATLRATIPPWVQSLYKIKDSYKLNSFGCLSFLVKRAREIKVRRRIAIFLQKIEESSFQYSYRSDPHSPIKE